MNNNILQSFVLDSLSKFNEFNVLESMRISNEILKKQYSSTMVNRLDLSLGFMDKILNSYKDVSESNEKLNDSFTKIYTSPKIDEVPVSVLVYDISEVSKIRPKYLLEFIKTLQKMLNDAVNDKLNDEDLIRLKSAKFANAVKCQLVETTLPEFVSEKDIVLYDNKMVQQVNSQYISTVILPFLRSYDYTFNNMSKLSQDIQNDIIDAFTSIELFSKTVTSLTERNLNLNPKKTSEVLSVGAKLTYDFSIYMISMYMRKISALINNTKEYFELNTKLSRYFPDLEHMLHESVIDGKPDLRDEEIVCSLLRGNSDIFSVLYSKTYDYYKSNLNVAQGNDLGDYFHSIIDDEVSAYEYDKIPYKNIGYILVEIDSGLYYIIKNLEDPDEPLDKIIAGSALYPGIYKMILPVLKTIDSVRYYDENESFTSADIFMSIMSELRDGDKYIRKFARSFELIYNKLVGIQKAISDNTNNHYENETRNIETLEWLRKFESDYRNSVLLIGKALINRVLNLSSIIERIDNGNYTTSIDDLLHESVDYLDYAFESMYDIIKEEGIIDVNKIYCDTMNESMNKIIDTSEFSLFSEADENQNNNTNNNGNNNQNNTQNNNNTSNQNNNNQSNTQNNSNQNTNNNSQNNNNQNNNNNQSNNQNNNQNQNNNSQNNNQNDNKTNEDKKNNIIDRILKFLDTIVDKLTKNTVKQRNFINNEENISYLTSRKYINNSIDNFHRYQTNITFQTALSNITDGLNSIDVNNINKDNVLSVYLDKTRKTDSSKLINNINNGEKNMGKAMTEYYKFMYGSQDVVTISNGELENTIKGENGMISYCKDFFNNYTTTVKNSKNNIKNKITSLNDKLNDKNNSGIMTELSRIVQTDIGAITNAYRDKAYEYFAILEKYANENPNKKKNNNSQNNNNQNNDNNNQNNNQNQNNNSQNNG